MIKSATKMSGKPISRPRMKAPVIERFMGDEKKFLEQEKYWCPENYTMRKTHTARSKGEAHDKLLVFFFTENVGVSDNALEKHEVYMSKSLLNSSSW